MSQTIDAPVIERNTIPSRGAAFFRDAAGTVQFTFVIDTTNVIGPRPATKSDAEKHPEAFSEFVRSEPKLAPVEVVVPLVAPEPVFKKYDGYEPLNITDEAPPAAPEPPRQKRTYTRRKG